MGKSLSLTNQKQQNICTNPFGDPLHSPSPQKKAYMESGLSIVQVESEWVKVHSPHNTLQKKKTALPPLSSRPTFNFQSCLSLLYLAWANIGRGTKELSDVPYRVCKERPFGHWLTNGLAFNVWSTARQLEGWADTWTFSGLENFVCLPGVLLGLEVNGDGFWFPGMLVRVVVEQILFYSGQELEYIRIYFSLRFVLLFKRLPSKEKEFQSTGWVNNVNFGGMFPKSDIGKASLSQKLLLTVRDCTLLYNLLEIRISWWAI